MTARTHHWLISLLAAHLLTGSASWAVTPCEKKAVDEAVSTLGPLKPSVLARVKTVLFDRFKKTQSSLEEAERALTQWTRALGKDRENVYEYETALYRYTKLLNDEARLTPNQKYLILPPRRYTFGEQFAREGGLFVTRFFSEKELKKTRIFFRDGKVYDSSGNLFDTSTGTRSAPARVGGQYFTQPTGTSIFVMDREGNFYALLHSKLGDTSHTSFFAGRPVAAAGEIRVIKGEVQMISNQSGHYAPPPLFQRQALQSLKAQGIDTDHIQTVIDPKTSESYWTQEYHRKGIGIPELTLD